MFALFPVSALSRVLPVPLIAVVPVSVRFSTFDPSVYAVELCTVSLPSPAFSVTTSPALSTT